MSYLHVHFLPLNVNITSKFYNFEFLYKVVFQFFLKWTMNKWLKIKGRLKYNISLGKESCNINLNLLENLQVFVHDNLIEVCVLLIMDVWLKCHSNFFNCCADKSLDNWCIWFFWNRNLSSLIQPKLAVYLQWWFNNSKVHLNI